MNREDSEERISGDFVFAVFAVHLYFLLHFPVKGRRIRQAGLPAPVSFDSFLNAL